jgi:hypothetical protein
VGTEAEALLGENRPEHNAAALWGAVQPVPYSVSGDIRATLVRILAYMGGLALLAILAASLFRDGAVVAAVNPVPRSDWVSIDRPHPAFELQMTEWALSNADYAILRRATDGGRKDVLSWGVPAASGPYVAVEIYRPGAAGEHFIDAASEIAARIVAFPVTDDVKAAGQLDTKFGTVSLVDFAVAAGGRSAGRRGEVRRCLGFAKPFANPRMQLSGWYCSPGEEVVDRAVLACALDRLTMLSAGGDPEMAALFARAEVKRTFCGQRSPILAATPEHAIAAPLPRDIKSARGLKLRGHISMRQKDSFISCL